MPDIFFDEASFSSALVNIVGALIVELDVESRRLSFNRTCEQLTGYAQDEIHGSSFDRFLIKNEISGVERTVSRLLNGEQRENYQNHWVTKMGDLIGSYASKKVWVSSWPDAWPRFTVVPPIFPARSLREP
jgi:PAS domain S-box-containing protein